MAYIREIVFGLQKKYRFKHCFPLAEPPLLRAVHDSNIEVVKRILNQGTLPDEPCKHKVTPLYVAIQNNNKMCTDMLVSFGANVNKHLTTIDADDDEIDMTPLILVSCLNHTEVVEILLHAKASVDEKAHDGMNALMFALANQSLECATMLLNNGASVNVIDDKYTSPLMVVANNGNVEMMGALISKGANVNHVNIFNNTPLAMSAC